MSLKGRIQEDVKNAMRAQQREQLAVLRLVTAAIKQKEVDERVDLDDEQVLAVLDKMVKQRRESLEQYRNAGRDDLAAQEEFELGLIQTYLPEPLSEAELATLIQSTIADTGSSIASRTSSGVRTTVSGNPLMRCLPLTSARNSPSVGAADPMVIFISSAVLSPTAIPERRCDAGGSR